MILDIIYGDEGEGNGIGTISQTAQRLRNPGQKRLRKACTEQQSRKFNESALQARDAQIKLLEQQLAHQEDWINYWKNKYKECLEELKKKTKSRIKWWRF